MNRTRVLAALLPCALLVGGTAGAQPPETARPARPWHDRLTGAALRAGVDPRRVEGLERAAAGDALFGYSYLMSAGDLNRDGAPDLFDVRVSYVENSDGDEVEQHVLDARSGRDGSLLWTVEEEPGAFWTFVVPAKVGPQAVDGVVYVRYSTIGRDTMVAGAGTLQLTVTAYDGQGKQVWSTPFAGAGAGSLAGTAGANATYVADFFDGVAGKATDLLLGTDVWAEAPTGDTAEQLQPQVLDGATGLVRESGLPVVAQDSYGGLLAVPDLSNDGLDDYVVQTSGSETLLAARRTSDGGALWSAELETDYVVVYSAGDTTGDGVADLAATDLSLLWDGAANGTVHLFDGAKGTHLWAKPGRDVIQLGNVDRRGGADLAVVSWDPTGPVGVRVEAFDSAGRSLWRVTRKVDASRFKGYKLERTVRRGGDVQGDGVADVSYSLVVVPLGAAERRDEGWIDGRTGRVSRAAAKDTWLLRGAIDGRNADTATATIARGVLTVVARSAASAQMLWSASVPVAGREVVWVEGMRLDSDACADVLVETGGGTDVAVAFDGATGAPKWSLRRVNGGDATLTRPKASKLTDRNGCR